MSEMLNAVHFCSGGGTTAEYVAIQANEGKLGNIRSAAIIASKPDIGAIERAKENGIPWQVLKNARDPKEILRVLSMYKARVASLNGWTPKIPEEVIEEFEEMGGVLINQHPGGARKDGLDFGGGGEYDEGDGKIKKYGMVGARPTAARILYLMETGARGAEIFTESTVQYVAPVVDRGAAVGVIRMGFEDEYEKFKQETGIMGPRQLEVISYDQYDPMAELIKKFVGEIQAKLLPLEHQNVANVFNRLGHGEKLIVDPNYYTSLVPSENEGILIECKNRAVQLFPKI